MNAIDYSAEVVRIEAQLAHVKQLGQIQQALKALDAKHDAEVAQIEQKHCEEQDSFAKENGYKSFKALMSELAPQPALEAKRPAKKTPAASKKQRKARAKLTREIKLEIAKAYMERGNKTAAEIAAKYGVSQYTVYKLAKTEVKQVGFVVGKL